ncbi:MAG: DUF3500 domain-containing protein [Pirellulales bacterium]|nr:DUF3500 domain-containing protein [Pirellulales bacterium]
MSSNERTCPDCSSPAPGLVRRDFLKVASVAVGAASAWPLVSRAADDAAAVSAPSAPESLVKVLYDKLTPGQREKVCYSWDHVDPKRGLLRTRVENNWHINDLVINSEFFTDEQRDLIRKIFEGIVQPDWIAKFDQQLEDDAGGFGNDQNIAIFGTPGEGKFQFVMTGRHMTVRCDGNSAEHVAFGGPIFYGHAARGFNEAADHPGNVFWPQALAANHLYGMLDGRQQKLALVEKTPREQANAFRKGGEAAPGISVSELSTDQKDELQKVLAKLVEPYRQGDRDEVVSCLKAQGGLDRCALAFYKEGDVGNDGRWDCWRLEGPAFVWYYRGAPHVHVWVNVADDPSVAYNA